MKKETLWIPVILTLVSILFFFPVIAKGHIPFPGDILVSEFQPWRSASYDGYAPGGIPNKAQYPDVIRQMYPWKTIAIDAIKDGRLPLWNPYNFSGAPLLANFQSQALYPFNVLYLLFPKHSAWTALVILQPLLAAYFMYLYMKKTGIGLFGSWLSALSYGFSGFLAVWLEYNTIGHVILWLPLMLLAIEHLRTGVSTRWLAVLAGTHAMALTAGHPQLFAYESAYVILYAACRVRRATLGYITGSALLGIGIAGIQLIPGLELIVHAARSPHDFSHLFTDILIQPWQMAALAFPNIFGNPATRTYWPSDTFIGKVTTIGLIPLFFSLSALRKKDRLTRWFLGSAAVLILLITANPITGILYRIPIPVFTSSSPTLMSFLLSFSLAAFCGHGLDYWMTERHSVRKLIRRSLQTAILFVALIAVSIFPDSTTFSLHGNITRKALLYGGAVSAATLGLFWAAIIRPKLQVYAIALLLVVHTLDLFVFFHRFNPFTPDSFIFPDHPVLTSLTKLSLQRYWGYGTAGIAANFASQYGIFSPEGYDPLYPARYGEFLYSYRTGRLLSGFDNATRSDAAVASSFGDGGLSDAKKEKILRALSVSVILDRDENGSTAEIFPPDTFEKTQKIADWSFYRHMNAAPRAFLTGDIRYYTDKADFSRQFFAENFDPSSAVLFAKSTPLQSIQQTATGSARITAYEPERVVIQTKSRSPALLVLTDTYYPGWSADIDGVPADIFPANWTLRAVPVPSGAHTVTMTYTPNSIRLGIFLSIISSAGLAVLLLRSHKKRT